MTETTPLKSRMSRTMSRSQSARGEVQFRDDHIDMDGSLKAAVFGFNDGLSANTCLMIGIASASGIDPSVVIASGLVGLCAGAASMGAGEWVSMVMQNKTELGEIEREREHIRRNQRAEDQIFNDNLRELGFSDATIASLAKDMSTGDAEKDLDMKVRLHAKIEMGLEVGEESGDPIKSMLFMMTAFSCGAIIPLLPWMPFWYQGPIASMWLSILCSLLASFLVGMKCSYFTCESPVATGMRQVFAGATAIFSVWFIGYLYQLISGSAAPAV